MFINPNEKIKIIEWITNEKKKKNYIEKKFQNKKINKAKKKKNNFCKKKNVNKSK